MRKETTGQKTMGKTTGQKTMGKTMGKAMGQKATGKTTGKTTGKAMGKAMGKAAVMIFAAALATATAHATTTNTFYVAAGETNSIDTIFAASNMTAFADGDWLVKTGKGTLTASATLLKDATVNFDIREGVYYVPDSVGEKKQHPFSSYIVRDGATLNLQGGKILFNEKVYVSFTGHGTGEGDNLGAIAVGGGLSNPSFGACSAFTMAGDATIYSYGSMNAIFSASAATTPSTLNMNGHTLTLLNKNAKSVFRPRWGWAIKNSGPIVVKNGQFARHTDRSKANMDTFTPNVPLVSFTDGAVMAVYGDTSLWNLVDAFAFEKGTKIAKGSNGETGKTMTLAKVTGPVAISSDATVTISKGFGVRTADLAAGDSLTAAKALTFAEGCVLTLEDMPASFTPGTTYTVATSDASISGTPTLTGAAAAFFTIRNSGSALTLTVKENALVLRTGEENAEANSAAIEQYAATLADGDAVYIPDSEYHFARSLDFSGVTAKGLTIASVGGGAVLHAGLVLGAAEGVTVKGLTFKGLEGPAVVATNTAGLVVTGCTLDHVTGAYADGANYPFAAVNVTGLTVCTNEFAFDELLWGAQAYLEGGSQTEASEARAGEIVFNAQKGKILDDWWWWGQVTNRLGLAVGAYAGRALRLIGGGALDSNDATCCAGAFGIDRVIIDHGQFVTRMAGGLGKAGTDVVVTNRGCLSLYKQSEAAANRKIHFSGTGVSDDCPAIRITGAAAWNKTDGVHWILEGDATMYNYCVGECGTFLRGWITMNGHTLTLTGRKNSNYRFGRWSRWYGGGKVIVKNPVTVSASATDDAGGPSNYKIAEGEAPLFIFESGSKFVPDNNDILQIISHVDFASGSGISVKDSIAGFCPMFSHFAGAPTVNAKVPSLGVTNTLSAAASDLAAGTWLKLAESKSQTLVLGSAGNRVTVELTGTVPETPTEMTLAEAAGGITGPRPRVSEKLRAAGWGVWFEEGRTVLKIGPRPGACVLLR